MNAAAPQQIHLAITEGWAMRTGRHLGRTLYLKNPEHDDPYTDICVGIVDSDELADAIRIRWNMHVMHQGLHR